MRMTSQYRVADSKREEFRKYLEKAGVLDSLTKVLVNLYEEPEKPSNALDFLKQHLHGGAPETADVEALKLEVSELRQKCEQLTAENAELKQRMNSANPPASALSHKSGALDKCLSWASDIPKESPTQSRTGSRKSVKTPVDAKSPLPSLPPFGDYKGGQGFGLQDTISELPE